MKALTLSAQSRGEVAPYDDGNDFSSWVYVVENSAWLGERHAYEWGNHETPLLETHQHYLFRVVHEGSVAEAAASGVKVSVPPVRPAAPERRALRSGLKTKTAIASIIRTANNNRRGIRVRVDMWISP